MAEFLRKERLLQIPVCTEIQGLACSISFFSEDLSFEEHPKGLDNFLTPFWYLNLEIRQTLTSPAWKDRVASGLHPFFCFFDGLCKYFDKKKSLTIHLTQNRSHRLSRNEIAELQSQVGKIKMSVPDSTVEI